LCLGGHATPSRSLPPPHPHPPPPLSLSLSHTHTYMNTHSLTRARTHSHPHSPSLHLARSLSPHNALSHPIVACSSALPVCADALFQNAMRRSRMAAGTPLEVENLSQSPFDAPMLETYRVSHNAPSPSPPSPRGGDKDSPPLSGIGVGYGRKVKSSVSSRSGETPSAAARPPSSCRDASAPASCRRVASVLRRRLSECVVVPWLCRHEPGVPYGIVSQQRHSLWRLRRHGREGHHDGAASVPDAGRGDDACTTKDGWQRLWWWWRWWR
jgi:hypothetical protein